MLGGNTWTVVFHTKFRPRGHMLPAYGNVRSRRGVVHRVIDEIRDSATQLLLVTPHVQAVINIKSKRMFVLAQRLRFVLNHA